MPPSVTVPGSKSITNRALLLAALSKGKSELNNVLFSDDTAVMIQALKSMGVTIEIDGNRLNIHGRGTLNAPEDLLFLQNAGTAVRFLTAILSNQPFTSQIEGDQHMQRRPIKDLIDALKSLEVEIESHNNCPPLTIHGKPITKKEVSISGSSSSQYTSALLMLAPLLPNGLTLKIEGELRSKPYIDITLNVMESFGINSMQRRDYESFTIPPQSYHPTHYTIEGDASSATYFAGLATITGKTIRLNHLKRDSIQPDIQVLDCFEKMGSVVSEDQDGITITGPQTLRPLGTINANDFPDGAMTVAAVASCAKGTTEILGLDNLRIKECDRLHALNTELTKIGVNVQEKEKSLLIQGDPDALHGATINPYADHRMAMCFGMLGARIPAIEVENPDCVSKTYPQFWDDLKQVMHELS